MTKQAARVCAPVFAALLVVLGVGTPTAGAATPTNGSITVAAIPWPPSSALPVVVTGTVTWNNVAGKTRYRCAQWTLTFDGVPVSGGPGDEVTSTTTSTFSHTFTAPANANARSNSISATCTVENQLAYGLINIDPLLAAGPITSAAQTRQSIPNAGGPSLWWLAAAGGLLVAGGVFIRQRR